MTDDATRMSLSPVESPRTARRLTLTRERGPLPSARCGQWTWLITAAYTQLRLARPLVADQRLPWEKPAKPGKLTPVRVRRGFRRLAATLGTPANPPKPSKAGPGRPKGTRRGPRTRHPAIKKTA